MGAILINHIHFHIIPTNLFLKKMEIQSVLLWEI